MSVRSLVQVIILGAVFAVSAAVAQAETWNAYDGFIPGTSSSSTQSTSNRWQYLSNANGDINSGYTLLPRWGDNGDGPTMDGWTGTDYWHNQVVLKNTTVGVTEVQVHPFDGLTSTVGWLSPIAGTVNVNFSLTDRNGTSGDGIEYWLYKSGAADNAWLKHDTLGNGTDWTTGTITASNISVAVGDMLYLRVGPGAANSIACDLTGVSFSVTSVPEPSTLVLLGAGLIGLLCYTWRKRK